MKDKKPPKALGQDPFADSFKWIGNTAEKQPIGSEIQDEQCLQSNPSKNITDNTIRQTYHLDKELIELIKKYAYIERMKISEVVNIALKEFFIMKKFQ